MRKEDLVTILLREIARSKGRDDELAQRREMALNYYQGKMVDAPEGRNNIVSLDVADGLHSVMASMEPLIYSTNIDFTPNGVDDEPQAQMESDTVKWVVKQKDGYAAIFNALHDGLLIGNGWIAVDAEEEIRVTKKKYPPLAPEQMYVLKQKQHKEEEIEFEKADDGTICVRSKPVKEIKFRTVPPENMIYSDEEGTTKVSDLRFLAERKLIRKGDLLDMGVPKKEIERMDRSMPTIQSQARVLEQITPDAVQHSADTIEVFRCFIQLDTSDSRHVNRLELHEVWLMGDYVISDEPAEFIPYVCGSPLPMPHRLEGQGIFTLLKNVQESKTHILREYLDNLSVANLGRVAAVEGQVNMGDLTNGRHNGIVRVRSPGAVEPLPYSDVGGAALQGLQYMDKVRTDRIGTSVDFNEVQAQIMQSSAIAAVGTIANAEKMTALYTRNIVETLLKPLFKLVHDTLRTMVTDVMMVKMRGKWIPANPWEWMERPLVESSMGMTSLEKATRQQALQQVITMQQTLYQAGADDILVDLNNTYNALMDSLRSLDVQNPEEYYKDPMSQEAQQAMQQKAEQAQQQQQMMMEMQKQLEAFKQEFELEKQRRDLEYKKWSDELKADIEEAKMIQKT